MKTILGSLALVLLGGVLLTSVPGCKNTCGETESGASGCKSTSVTEFKGTAKTESVPYTPGDSISIETVYGEVNVVQGTADQIQVTFEPFDYEGYEEEALAVRQMNENLEFNISGTAFSVLRKGDPTNGLGGHITVKLPTNFNGTLTVKNHGDGPLQYFDSNVDYVGQAIAVSVTGDSAIGNCTVKGAVSVVNTTVNCGDLVTVSGVSDNVNITARDGTGFDEPTVIVSLASISATATGGTIHSGDGPIDMTFPSGAVFSVQSTANKGSVNEGTVPSNCTIETAAETAKTVSCGVGGPNYVLTADGENGSVFEHAGTIYLHL